MHFLCSRFCRDAFDANYKGTIGVDFEIEKFRILDLSFNLQMYVKHARVPPVMTGVHE